MYSSDLIRAVKTAEAIYKPKGLVLHKESGLREMNLGIWEDRGWEELPSAFPEEHKYGILNSGDLSDIAGFGWGDNTSVSCFAADGGCIHKWIAKPWCCGIA